MSSDQNDSQPVIPSSGNNQSIEQIIPGPLQPGYQMHQLFMVLGQSVNQYGEVNESLHSIHDREADAINAAARLLRDMVRKYLNLNESKFVDKHISEERPRSRQGPTSPVVYYTGELKLDSLKKDPEHEGNELTGHVSTCVVPAWLAAQRADEERPPKLYYLQKVLSTSSSGEVRVVNRGYVYKEYSDAVEAWARLVHELDGVDDGEGSRWVMIRKGLSTTLIETKVSYEINVLGVIEHKEGFLYWPIMNFTAAS